MEAGSGYRRRLLIVPILAASITCLLFMLGSCNSDASGVAAISSSSVSGESAPTVSTSSAQSSTEAVDEKIALVIDQDPTLYTYEDLAHDVSALANNYPEWVHKDSLGTTADGRELFHLVIGNPNATNKVLIHAGIHAREYMTTQLVMKQASAFLAHAAAGDDYGGTSYAAFLEANALHLVPSVNPDGAALSQQGINGIRDAAVKSTVLAIAESDGSDASDGYFRNWKANANGVDLNRNFDALWDSYSGAGHPSSELYKGSAPGCEAESAALIALTEREQFSHTISYHAQGSLVYWYFGQTGVLYDSTQRFADDIANQTGYQTYANFENLDPAGYKDWALQSMAIPSLTIEIGLGEVPLPADQFESIWLQNEYVWEITLSQ